jgi:hypothetical protein
LIGRLIRSRSSSPTVSPFSKLKTFRRWELLPHNNKISSSVIWIGPTPVSMIRVMWMNSRKVASKRKFQTVMQGKFQLVASSINQ